MERGRVGAMAMAMAVGLVVGGARLGGGRGRRVSVGGVRVCLEGGKEKARANRVRGRRGAGTRETRGGGRLPFVPFPAFGARGGGGVKIRGAPPEGGASSNGEEGGTLCVEIVGKRKRASDALPASARTIPPHQGVP